MADKKPAAKKAVKKKSTVAKKTVKKVVKKVSPKKDSVKKISAKKKITAKKTANKKNTKAKKTTIKKLVVKKVAAKKVTKSFVKKINPAKSSSEMGLFSRFWRVFTPTFLTKLGVQKSQGKSWGFWFLSNFFLILIPTIAFFIFLGPFLAGFPNNALNEIPNDTSITIDNGQSYNVKSLIKNFELNLSADGKLTSKNIPDPLIFVGNESDETGSFYTSLENLESNSAKFAFVLDTKNVLDIENSGKNFGSYLYILGDGALIFDGSKNKMQFIDYKDIVATQENSEFPKTINYKNLKGIKSFLWAFATVFILIMMIFIYLFLSVARLVNALFWALIFWAIGAIAQVKNWNFEKSFMAMLHFSFVTMLLVPLAFLFDSVFIYAFILLGILFGMNFWEMEKK